MKSIQTRVRSYPEIRIQRGWQADGRQSYPDLEVTGIDMADGMVERIRLILP